MFTVYEKGIGNMYYDSFSHILHIKINEDSEINLESIRSHLDQRSIICKEPYVAIIDASNYCKIEYTEIECLLNHPNLVLCLGNIFYNISLANKIAKLYFKNLASDDKLFIYCKTKENAIETARKILNQI